MKRVWVVEYGDYDNRFVALVAKSKKAAVDAVKRRYKFPYVVEWEPPKKSTFHQKNKPEWILVGHFEAVRGYSTKHTSSFDITSYEVEA